jgi:uncharacterized protein (TIGR02145 family)
MKFKLYILMIIAMFSLITCAFQTDYINRAREEHTIEAYREYLEKFPDGEYVDEAKKNITEIMAFNKAVKNDLIDDYNQFITDYPNSKFSDIVKKKLFYLENDGKLVDQDGNLYKMVIIGDQIWMAENLKVTHYRNGDPIPNVTSPAEWDVLSTGAYCVYDNNESYADTYGYLYNWYAVTDDRSIAPEGWHVPTDKEWKQLYLYLGISRFDMLFSCPSWIGDDEGGKMKEVSTTYWNSPNTGATNESGLSARPGGVRGKNGNYGLIGLHAYFWSTSKANLNLASYHMLSSTSSWIFWHYSYKNFGFSVRCVKD